MQKNLFQLKKVFNIENGKPKMQIKEVFDCILNLLDDFLVNNICATAMNHSMINNGQKNYLK